MKREFYTDLGASGHRMPVGADLVLHEKPDRDAILDDGARLGQVIAEAARRYHTPLAFPLMDLTIEKQAFLSILGGPDAAQASHHFSKALSNDDFERLIVDSAHAHTVRMQATCDAVAYVANSTELAPVGMCIGPFSLMTKLIAEPITPIYMAGTGVTSSEDDEVKLVEQCLALAEVLIRNWISSQVSAGAVAIFVCEPGANTAFFSPKQLKTGSDIFERYVIEPNKRLSRLLRDSDVDLIFHDCGVITDQMLSRFVELDPAILSLGSSRCLWDDAALVPNSTVLYGNLPSKKFYSDAEMSVDAVKDMTRQLAARMRDTKHPFILGSECDILAVPGAMDAIVKKTEAFLTVDA